MILIWEDTNMGSSPIHKHSPVENASIASHSYTETADETPARRFEPQSVLREPRSVVGTVPWFW